MNTAVKTLLYGGALVLLFLVSLKNYLLFHNLAELFSIVIAFGIFVIGWNSRKYYKNNYLLFIGIAYLFVAFFDTLHTLAYKGMAVFKEYDDNNLPPQLWLVARYMESIALLLAPTFFSRPVRQWRIVSLFIAVSALSIYAIFFADIFPVCFVAGSGLTPFKVGSEYLIDIILCAALYLLYKNRGHFEPGVLRLLTLSIACTMVTELCFTVYVHLYGISNLIGHFFKILSFWFMYRAIIETALSRPYDLLFRELHTKEVQFANAFHYAPIGIALVAPDGRWLKANHAVCAMVGYTEGELVSRTFQEITHPDDLETDLGQVRQILDGTIKSYQLEKRYLHKNGAVIWALLSVSLVRDDEGNPLHFINQLVDITDRKQAEIVLRESEERFSITFNNAPIMISISKLEDGTYLDVNQRFLDTSGFSRDEVIGKTSIELGWVSEADRNKMKETMLRDGRVVEMELGLRTKSGKSLICSFWAEMIMLAGQKRLLSIAMDITEHRAIERQFIQAQKMESIGRLAGGVAHDFNNMLGVILGYAELGLMRLDPANPVCANLKEISNAAKRSADLTHQLLAFARKQTIAPKVLELNETVSGMLKMLQRLIGEDIHLNWRPAPTLWRIKADPSQLDQLLANLCVNARDAIKNTGRITIETRNNTIDAEYCKDHPDAVPGEYVHLSVTDDGSGMDKDTAEQIFEPFFTTKALGEGTGLGLATVYGIIKQNNGFITVSSEPGHGTTFSIHFPRFETIAQQTPVEVIAAPLPSGEETVILVEDEPAILATTAAMLEMQGYTVLKAENPGEALKIAAGHVGHIHLLLTDVIMPGMNGRDLADRVQAIYPKMKLLFMSGYTADIIAHHGVLDEGVHFIQKPFKFPDLVTKVRVVLDGK